MEPLVPSRMRIESGRTGRARRCMLYIVSRAIDAFAVVLLFAAASAFCVGIYALGQRDDFKAIYLLVVGALALRSSTELLRPRGGGS
jgi:hypothetical protein